ncbi:transferrin receptor 1b isoform X2 [Mastacembelus armatus]|uniref:transferrin receptor 1b isoform X2 n=1 Tax=Mastacembelus armatus TaxID=205130 RepID=UPI000E460695|nr:transferrin receptor protein 1-like isoform X2 [Mastacembelus armatus]
MDYVIEQIKSERYSRFTMQGAGDGERHVEVKLSDDAADESTEVEGQAQGSPTFMPAPKHQSRRNICYLVLGILLIFITGYLVGYISYHKPQVEPGSCDTGLKETPSDAGPAPEFHLDWTDITKLLTQKLTSEGFDKTLRDFDLPKRSAGSEEEIKLANRIFDEFKKQDMDPWTDIHYVQLPIPDSEHPNRVLFGSDVFEPVGYLAYSAPGKVEGKLVYGNYGRQQDLNILQTKNIELKDSVLLLRSGKISFAEQVDNAATKGASAVLIYPDIQDYKYLADTALYGHVHLGSGDPYTPGFPSFNHTQFPPTQSSGLPKIPAQTITANMASALLQNIGGPELDESSGFKGGFKSYRLGGTENITVEVNNVLVTRKIHNVFGVIKGFTDPDRYVVLGAQRDAWGKGYSRAAVGTSVLIELAKAVREMVEKNGFRPRRSLVFASWSAGEYGNVGVTEWLEGYMSSLDKRVFTYISLDSLVMGRGNFTVSASPLLYSLIESTMKVVKSPLGPGTVYDIVGKNNWEASVLRPMSMDDPAYPFLAFSGIPSVSFHFIAPNTESYAYYGTNLDNMDHLNYQTSHRTSEMTAVAAQFAGQMALRLVHDHLLRLDVSRYKNILTKAVNKVYKQIQRLSQSGQLKDVNPKWISLALGSFKRAADDIKGAVLNTNLNDEACRIFNDRLMRVENTLLSPYVSPVQTPFRHLLLGQGSHTLASLAETTDMDQLRVQLALATWNLKGCANAMVGDIWEIDNEI